MIDPDGPDEPIVAAARRGDEWAFRALYRRHTPRAYAVTLRLLAWRRHEADDAVQEAWLRAASGLGRFRGDSTFATWFTGIAIRCALEQQRRGWRSAAAADPGPVFVAPPAAESSLDLERAIAGLADGYRTVLLLHDVHGHTHAEIAALLGIDEGTSKSQLSRARRIVRARLRPGASETGT